MKSLEKHQSVPGKNILKSQKYVSSAPVLMLIDYSLVYYTVGSITFLNGICTFMQQWRMIGNE